MVAGGSQPVSSYWIDPSARNRGISKSDSSLLHRHGESGEIGAVNGRGGDGLGRLGQHDERARQAISVGDLAPVEAMMVRWLPPPDTAVGRRLEIQPMLADHTECVMVRCMSIALSEPLACMAIAAGRQKPSPVGVHSQTAFAVLAVNSPLG